MAINVGNLVKSFKAASTATGINSRQAFRNFIKDNDAKGFSTVNYAARMNQGIDGMPAAEIRTSSVPARQSDFLAVPGAPNGEHYVLPNFRTYSDNYHAERGLGDMFDSNFVPGKTYDIKKVSDIIPGRGIVNADGTLTMTQRGSIDFDNGNPIVRHFRNDATGKYGKGSPDKGPITPEQQIAEDLAADNAKLLEEGGQPVVEPSKVTPQPSQPVPDKTVTTPEPKPVDPVPETGKPVTPREEPADVKKQDEPRATDVSADDAVNRRIAENLGLDINKAEDRRLVEAAKNSGPVTKAMISAKAKALSTGSGKTIQESANNVSSNGPVNMTIDRAMLQQKIGGDKTTWGRKDAEEYLLNNVTKKLEDQQLAIAQNKSLTSEQRLSEWNKHKKEAEDILAEGPGIGDYFFGNKLHYAAVGSAALFGAGSAAFGGHKSNAELYSSPF